MKKLVLPAIVLAASLALSGCGTKNYYYITPPRGSSGSSGSSKKAPANWSPSTDGFQAVTKPTSYSSY